MQSTSSPPSPSVQSPPVDVRLDHASISFSDHFQAVRDVSLSIPQGQFTSLLGPSGCGKSTLLRAIAGLQPLTSGSLSATHDSTAFVFQEPNLLPWRTVLRNVALPLELRGVPKSERLDRAAQALSQLGLSDALRRYPAQLSGGMKMRTSLARALVTNPRLLLLDEPFAALDEITRTRLDEMLRDLWLSASPNRTVLFVTHSIPEAVYLSQRAIVFSRRPASILLDHTIDLPLTRPGTIRTETPFALHSRALYDALYTAESGEKKASHR